MLKLIDRQIDGQKAEKMIFQRLVNSDKKVAAIDSNWRHYSHWCIPCTPIIIIIIIIIVFNHFENNYHLE